MQRQSLHQILEIRDKFAAMLRDYLLTHFLAGWIGLGLAAEAALERVWALCRFVTNVIGDAA